MPFMKGRKKTGGRKKGSITKDRQMVIDKCAELGVDPFTILAHLANGDWKALGYDAPGAIKRDKFCEWLELTISPDTREKAASNLARHIVPQLKAVDVAVTDLPNNGKLSVTLDLGSANANPSSPAGVDPAAKKII